MTMESTNDYDNGKSKPKDTTLKHRILIGLLGCVVLYMIFPTRLFKSTRFQPIIFKRVIDHALKVTEKDYQDLSDPFGLKRAASDPDKLWVERQARVKSAINETWQAYYQHAFPSDEYLPLSMTGRNFTTQSIGYFLVDSLDTLLLAGLTREFEVARDWIVQNLNFNIDVYVSVFEMNIRMLGGLLSAFHMTRDPVFLEKAIDLGERLLSAFETETGIPFPQVNLQTGQGKVGPNGNKCILAEVATLQLEMKYLSHLTGDMKFWNAAEKIMDILEQNETVDGLAPVLIDMTTGKFASKEISLGSMGDSYYEYLLKQWLLTGQTEDRYRDMYDHAIEGIQRQLVGYSEPSNFCFLYERFYSEYAPQMQHLACFIGGNLALGSTLGAKADSIVNWPQDDQDDFNLGKNLTKTCYKINSNTATGLAPEMVYFHDRISNGSHQTYNKNFYTRTWTAEGLLRPEAVESLFLLWRTTGDVQYRFLFSFNG